MKKNFTSILLACLAIFSLPALAGIQKTQSTGQNINVLFVQSAPKAELIPNKTQPGTYELALYNIKKNVAYFSDRPERITGNMPISKFLTFWQQKGPDSFSVQAPNADVNGIKMHSIFSTKIANFVFELSQPTYDAKRQTMAYLATPLQGPQQKQLPTCTMKLTHVKLFFDNMTFCPSCNGPP